MSRGDRINLVTFERPGAPVPDGDGGFTEVWAALNPPTWYVAIRPATLRDLENETAGAVTATATHIVEGDYRPDVTTNARMLHTDPYRVPHVYHVNGVENVDNRGIVLKLFVEERLG